MQPARQQCSSGDDAADSKGLVAHAVGCPSDREEAGRADVCQGCPGRELCLSQSREDTDQKFIDVRMRAVRRKIVVLSGKGGVGKSSIASCLSMALASLSAKVGLVDLDICGPSIPKLMSVGGDVVVNGPYGWVPLSSPHGGVKEVALATMRKEVDFCRKMNLKVMGVVENMSGYQCPCCQALVQCCEEGRSVFTDHPESPAATAIMKIATNIHNNVTHLQPT
ncbi:Cytosolic Fe-S cluster assembly factor NBP35 [Geodia barretti]|uniref:Cytosolic Fe-S cluster assembly factor NBP35 n=1 Tax=Geodia barretti TaxID=519541 RepID=A0AA35RSR7_GEOBA|nr:Cytosolic Fe-S cluster assembly factor NBP35 [Geodia barretti]